MADELIDIFDESNDPTAIQKMKSEAHRDGLWHRAVHIWIYNQNGEILFQLRAKEKELYPNLWDISVAGHVSAGEDPSVSALREIKEEIGVEAIADDLQLFKVFKQQKSLRNYIDNEFCYVYLFKYNGDISNLSLQDEEVQEIKYISLVGIEDELKINNEKYVPHGGFWFDPISEVKNRLDI